MLAPHWRPIFSMHLFFYVHTSYMLSLFLCFSSNLCFDCNCCSTVGSWRKYGLELNDDGMQQCCLAHMQLLGEFIQLRTIGFVCYFWYPPLYLILIFGHGTAEVCSYKFPFPDYFICGYKYCFVICSIVVNQVSPRIGTKFLCSTYIIDYWHV